MKKNFFYILFCGFMLFIIFFYPKETITTVTGVTELFMSSVFPSLFPFFVLSSILKQTGLIEYLIYKSKKDYNLIFTTIIGLMCGYPSTSKLIGQSDTMKERADIYALSTAPNPIFVTGTLCTVFLGESSLALYILPAIYLSLISSYFITKLLFPCKKAKVIVPPKINNQPFGNLLFKAILDGLKTQGIILGIIIIMSIFANGLSSLNVFYYLTKPLLPVFNLLNIPSNSAQTLVSSIIEMSKGNSDLSALAISLNHKIIFTTFLTAFGGITVLVESLAFLQGKIKASKIIAIKLLHGVLGAIYANLLLILFPFEAQVFKYEVYFNPNQPLYFLIASIVSLLIIVVIKIVSKRHQS